VSTPDRILIIRMSALGDVINTLPALGALKRAYPASHISWLVEPAFAPVVEAQPEVDQAIIIPRKRWQKWLTRPGKWRLAASEVRQLLGDIREPRFDVALDFQSNLRSGLLTRLSNAPRRIGFHPRDLKEPDLGSATETAPPLPGECHRVERALHLLRALDIDPGSAAASLAIPSEATARVDEFLGGLGLAGKPLIAIHPGTSRFGAYKRWTDDGYRELCRHLADEMNACVVLTWGSASEREGVEQLREGLLGAVVVSFETTLIELAALLSRADLFVGGDTGPGHLASLVGTPVVSIFGPKGPDIYRPYFSPCWVVERDLWCRPCARRTCSSPACLTEIGTDHVLRAVVAALEGEAGAQSEANGTRLRSYLANF